MYFQVYFQVKSYLVLKLNHLRQYHSREFHTKQFVQVSENIAKTLDLEEWISTIESYYIPEVFEFVDNTFTYIFNTATASAEGPLRNVPYSPDKLKKIRVTAIGRKDLNNYQEQLLI